MNYNIQKNYTPFFMGVKGDRGNELPRRRVARHQKQIKNPGGGLASSRIYARLRMKP
jgi:hypothetical protein